MAHRDEWALGNREEAPERKVEKKKNKGGIRGAAMQTQHRAGQTCRGRSVDVWGRAEYGEHKNPFVLPLFFPPSDALSPIHVFLLRSEVGKERKKENGGGTLQCNGLQIRFRGRELSRKGTK